jgi:putative GTP pyrophosphokinase
MEITRSRIKAIGKKLRDLDQSNTLSDDDLQDLTSWRNSHGPSLNYLLGILEKELQAIGLHTTEYFLTQRLKRIFSIKLKLDRFENMQLSMMDDIAGARVVAPSFQNINDIFIRLKEKKFKYTLLKVNNYTSVPKKDGYRSIHLVYRTNKNPSVQIELQLRSELQHVWATAVEVFGTIVKTSFKTGDGENNWREFFKLLSTKFAMKEGTTVLAEHERYTVKEIDRMLITLIKTLNVFEKLTAYTSIYYSDWESKRKKGRVGKYALLILNNLTGHTDVEFYAENDRLKGLKRYSDLEKDYIESDNINTVFISIDNMNKLVDAYPNYFMDTKKLVKYLADIVLGKF